MTPVDTAVSVPAVAAGRDEAVGSPQWESWEICLASETAARLRRAFPQKPEARVVAELLDGMREERKARERLNLNHWPEYGPRFLERLAEKWKIQEAERLAAIPGFLKAKRREMLNLALAVTDNLPDAEEALAESDFELLTGAADEALYPLSVKRNAVDVVRRRERGDDVLMPLERVLEAGDDCAGDFDDGGEERTALGPSSLACDAKDPLQLILDRKNQHLRRSNLSRAKKRAATRRKYKWARRKNWAKKLGIGPKSGTETPH